MTKKANQDELEYERPECGEPVSKIVYSCPKCGTAFEDEEEEEYVYFKKEDDHKEDEGKIEEIESISEEKVISGPVQYSPSVEPESDHLRLYRDRREEERKKNIHGFIK